MITGNIEHYDKFISLLFIQNRRNNKLFKNSFMVPSKHRVLYIKILYIKSNDATIKIFIFILPSNPCKNCSYKQYLNNLTYEKSYNKVGEIEYCCTYILVHV